MDANLEETKTLEPCEAVEGFQLSKQQEQLWPTCQNAASYRSCCLIQIDGSLDVDALKKAIRLVIQRHRILQTRFQTLSGLRFPLQVVDENMGFAWEVLDLRNCGDFSQLDKAEAVWDNERNRPFNQSPNTSVHATLVLFSNVRSALIIGASALHADRYSLKLLVKEIGNCYAMVDEESETFEEPMQYVQFSEWQREFLEEIGDSSDSVLPGRQHAHSLSVQRAPFERAEAEENCFEPRYITLDLGTKVSAKIGSITAGHNATEAAFLSACWQVLLWRLSERDPIIIASGFSGRFCEELDDLIGPFETYIPLQNCLKDDTPFLHVLEEVVKANEAASESQEFFGWLQDETTMRPDFDGRFSLGFVFDELPQPYNRAGVEFSIQKWYHCSEHFKLKLFVFRMGESLIAEVHYDQSRFDVVDVKRITNYFQKLVETMCKNLLQPVGSCDILDASEKCQLVLEFNDPNQEFTANQLTHQLFEQKAAQYPDSVAIVWKSDSITYAELNDRSNRLARYLLTCGAKPDSLVGICVERSPDMIVGALAVLKAGAAYVPLDPTYPAERLAYSISQSSVKILLTHYQFVENFSGRVKPICVDRDWRVIAEQRPENLNIGCAKNLAYVIYTSGDVVRKKWTVD